MKTILITGASSGMGEACAEKLASAGVRFILCARTFEELNNIKKNLEESAVDSISTGWMINNL